jgi:hypothetical protein
MPKLGFIGILGGAASSTLFGCGGDMSDKAAAKIREQASFDLQCDKTKLTVPRLGA